MRKLLIPIALVFILLVSGCVSMDPTSLVKATPAVSKFLEDYPNAEVKATHYTAEESAMVLDSINADCEKEVVTPKEYYKVTITDAESDLDVVAWVDVANQLVECVVKRGSSGDVDVTECENNYKVKCSDGHLYWFDSCGNKEEKHTYCEKGCEDDACREGETCRNMHQVKCYDGHAYWYDSCGNRQEKKEYCENGCEDGVCLELGHDTYCEYSGESKAECRIFTNDPIDVEIKGDAYAFNYAGSKGSKVVLIIDGSVYESPTASSLEHGDLKIEVGAAGNIGNKYQFVDLTITSDAPDETPCTDTDGYDIYTKGKVTDRLGRESVDYCLKEEGFEGRVVEYTCNEFGTANGEDVLCEDGCEDGACIKGQECEPVSYRVYDDTVTVVHNTGCSPSVSMSFLSLTDTIAGANIEFMLEGEIYDVRYADQTRYQIVEEADNIAVAILGINTETDPAYALVEVMPSFCGDTKCKVYTDGHASFDTEGTMGPVTHGISTVQINENGGSAKITVEGEEYTVSSGDKFTHESVEYEVVFVVIQPDGAAYVSLNHGQ